MKRCPRCKVEIPSHRRYCDLCNVLQKEDAQERWKQRNPEYNKFYLREWKKRLLKIEQECLKRCFSQKTKTSQMRPYDEKER